MREQGRMGRVIKAVLGVHAGRKHQDGVSLDTLRSPTLGLVGDPQAIHTLTTEHFVQHYAIPPDANNDLHRSPDWLPLVMDKERFMRVSLPTPTFHPGASTTFTLPSSLKMVPLRCLRI